MIILEFINPQLIKRDIEFKTIAPPPTINARASIAAVAQQQTTALMAGLDSCVQKLTSPSPSGANMLTTINVSTCGTFENKVTQLSIFARNCTAAGGRDYPNGVGSDRATCAVPIVNGAALAAATREAQTQLAYIKKTFSYTADHDGDGLNTRYFITDDYIRLDGSKIIIDIGGFCDASFSIANTPVLSPLQRRNILDDCKVYNGGGLTGSIEGRCEVIDAKTTYSNGVLTCQMPLAKIAATSLKVSDPQAGGDREPKDWTELVAACKALGGDLYKDGGIVWQSLDWNGIDLSDYTCIDYN